MNVLFIGNSHVYMHFMPRMLMALVKTADRGDTLVAEQCTGESVSLEWHWYNRATQDMLASKRWDYVVLQDRAGGPLEAGESFERHARLLDQEIKRQGARTVFYMTWALRRQPETQANLTEAYRQIADKLGAKLAPVGLVWEKVRKKKPDIDLFHEDGRHANSTGAYLTACVFFSVLLGASPEGLPGKLHINGKNRVDLDKGRALFLQRIAHSTVAGTGHAVRSTK